MNRAGRRRRLTRVNARSGGMRKHHIGHRAHYAEHPEVRRVEANHAPFGLRRDGSDVVSHGVVPVTAHINQNGRRVKIVPIMANIYLFYTFTYRFNTGGNHDIL
jgi:hypothetical protein